MLDIIGLGGNPDLSAITFADDEEWLELRKAGIGGSDAGALMGLSPYESPLSVYRTKVENRVKNLDDNANVRRGKDLEDLILTKYVQPELRKWGYLVEKPTFIITNSKYPYLRANLDGVARSMTGTDYTSSMVIEIKCISEYGTTNWDGPDYCGVPAYYYAQVQHYMAVTGMNVAYIFALFDKTWTVKHYRIPRDDAFISKMLKVLSTFYNINMNMHIPPMAVLSKDSKDLVESGAPLRDNDSDTPSDEMSELVKRYKELSTSEKTLKTDIKTTQDRIFELWKTGNKPSDPNMKVNFKQITMQRLNTAKLKQDKPDLYEQYCDESKSIRTDIR